MKNFLIGVIYTIVIAGTLAHFTGCDAPDLDYYLEAGLNAIATPTPIPELNKDDEETKQEAKADVTVAPSPTAVTTPVSTPTPEEKAAATPTATSAPTSAAVDDITATPTPGSTEADVKDDVDAVLALIPREDVLVSLTNAADFYYETEKAATAGFIKKATRYISFSMAYKDKNCMHTPEYFLENYPEFHSVEIDYSTSKRYKNAIYVNYNVSLKKGGQYAYAVRTGDTSNLEEDELAALKAIVKLSKEMKLAGMDKLEMIKTVHDYLINNTRYSDPLGYDLLGNAVYADATHTPYGLLNDHVAVCDGYAQSFMIFMLVNDVECETITGVASDKGNTESHAWNQVLLDGKWYNIDVTWDDPVTSDGKDVLKYTYFLADDAEFDRTHISECGYEHACTDDSLYMYMYDEYICRDIDGVKAQIERQIKNETIILIYRESDFTKRELDDAFLDLHNVGFKSYNPERLKGEYMLYEIINPLK